MPSLSELKRAIATAITEYQTHNPLRSRSKHRQNDLKNIAAICKAASNQQQLVEALEDYFSSPDYYTGLTDGSNLEKRISTAMKSNLTNNGITGKDNNISLSYTLTDFVNYAIDKYTQEKGAAIPTYRCQEIDTIREILDSAEDDNAIATNLKNFIATDLSHSFNSNFKKYLLFALKQSTDTRSVPARIWQPKLSSSEKILLCLHGWHDSSEAMQQLAQEAVRKGYTVIAYDHRGHGNDKQRKQRSISPDLLRLDFRLLVTQVQKQYPNAELALVGHSMGGAILLNEQEFIKQNSAIKYVGLIAPAVMSSFSKLVSPAKVFYRNMHSDVRKQQQASPRFGGHGPSLWQLLAFMRTAAQSLTTLFTSTNNDDPEVTWKIYSGKKDASVNYQEFTPLSQKTNKPVHFFPRGDHALQFGHHAGTVNRLIVKEMDESLHAAGRKSLSQTIF